MLKRTLRGFVIVFALAFASPSWAQSGASVQYTYDALGRLTSVVDPSGNVATYNYDAVGNLSSITRSTSSPSALAILGFSPAQGPVGQTVAIQGQNFSTTPGANTVKFNGTTATVTAATANSLTVTVPAGATNGPISVTVGSTTATSNASFTVLATSLISSVSPTSTVQTPTISNFQVTGSNLTGATFSFVPAFSPAAITISNVNINPNGTSATMTLTLASNAAGSFALVATNGNGSTSAVPSANNTLTILSSDASVDSDGDGLTNIYESAIGSNYANFSTPGDGIPDGWALFYTSAPPLGAALASQTAPNGLTYLQSFQRGLNPLIPNLVPPAVSNIFPANNATNYPTNGVIVLRFSEPLSAGVDLPTVQKAINTALPGQSNFSAANALNAAQVLQTYLQRTCCASSAAPGVIQVLQNGKPVAGSISLSNDRLSMIFAPTKQLSTSTTFSVVVQGVRDAAGNLMTQPFQSSFTTGLTTINNTAGGVTFTNPPNAATNVPTNTPFMVEFSTQVNPATLTPQTMFVTDTSTGLTVPGMLQIDSSGLTASFVPQQPYGAERIFHATLTSGIQSVTGSSFPPVTYVFTTGFGPDVQAPTLVATSPVDGASGIPLNAQVVLEFNEPVDEIGALTGLQVQLAGVPVLGAVSLSDGNKRITFIPASALNASSTYEIVTTWRLTDVAGNQLANPGSSFFTTGIASDLTSPTVTNVSPANNATGVPTNAFVQLRFSKQIDPITLTNSTFDVLVATNSGGQQPINGAIVVSSDGLTATFTPASPLIPATTYHIGFSTQIADLEGHALQTSTNYSFTAGIGPVTSAPTVVAVSPQNGTTGVQVNAHVGVQASAPISLASLGSNVITVSAGGSSVNGTLSLSNDLTTLSFVPTGLLAVSTTYTINVSGFTDQAGNVGLPFTSSFTTGTSGVADTSTLTVVSISPAGGATGVPVTSTIVLTFNKNVDPSSVNNSNIPVATNGALNPVLAGSYAVSGSTVTFTPLTPFPGSTTVFTGVFPNVVKDLAGNGSGNYSFAFTTAAVTDTTPPQVVAVTPNNGATGIGTNGNIVVTFSKSMNPSTLTTNNIALFANGKRMTLFVSVSADTRTAILGIAGLPGSTVNSLVITPGVKDLSGNSLANFKSQFTTVAVDTTHPTVASQRPGPGATGVPLNANVVLYASEPMNTLTIPGALHLEQNGAPVSGNVQTTHNGQVIQFTPGVPFLSNAFIQIFLDPTALDTDGNSLANYQGSFTTSLGNTLAPAEVNTNPPFVTGVPTNAVLQVGFDQPLNSATVNTTTVMLLQGTNTVSSTVSLLGGGAIIQVTPSAVLSANTNYSIQITSAVQGTNGLALQFSGAYLSFTTGAGTDTISPTVQQVSPPNGSVNVGDNVNIRIHFSKVIDPLTVTASTIVISGGGVTQVPYTLSFSGYQDVLIVPYSPLPDSTQMTVAISGITDVAGNVVVPQTIHFTTGAGPDVTNPIVINTNPFSGEQNVPLNAPVMLQTNKPIDPATVNTNTFVVEDNTTFQSVSGSYSLSADGQTISFVPSAPLAASRTYNVFFTSSGITDLTGNLIGSSPPSLPSYSFVTGTAANATAPQVTGISPSNGATAVPINAQVVIQFNEPVDALTVNQVTLNGGGTVNVARTLSNGNQTLVLVPITPLNPSTTYTVTITGVQDASGNSLVAPVTASFTTGTGADLTLPSVASVSPVNNATGVATNTVIQLHFSKQIDPFTVTNSTFIVFPDSVGSGHPIAGTITVSPDGLTATFTPSAALAVSTSYDLSATLGVMDIEGQPLTPFDSFFKTGTQ